MAKPPKHQPTSPSKPLAGQQPTNRKRRLPLLSPYLLLFALVWAWAALWYGDVFRIAREYSFWAPDETLMHYQQGRPWGMLWQAGLALLQLYRWPLLGALLTATLVTKPTYLLAYCLRLRGWWRLIAFLPALGYTGRIAYVGLDLFFETETGMILGIPLLYTLVLAVLAGIIRSFSRKPMPSWVRVDAAEPPRQSLALTGMALVVVALPMSITHWTRPYVRVVTTMQRQQMEQDWKGMAETARSRAELSYRPIAAFYAIALVQRGEQGSRLFDIRMDYDQPHLHGFDGKTGNAANYYLMDCDFYAGLVQTSIHHAMEQMTMNGPNLRALKLLTKGALMRGEWAVAEKYLTILSRVPFEGKWVAKYKAMVGDMERVNNDPEFRMVRLTEPISDTFENYYIQPVFLGYNAALTEGRSINALWNSLAVQLYTKTMPQFLFRSQPLQGSTPPQSFAEALTLLSGKNPDILQQYTGLEYQRERMGRFLTEVQPLMKERPQHALRLFPKYKGYYPYYYFFGNLKATKKTKENEGTSNSGVN